MTPIQQLALANSLRGRKVFVTGHTGFKGSWLCEWLILIGAEVTGFSLPGKVTEPSLFDQLDLSSQLEDRRGDIRDAQAIKRILLTSQPDFVFHLAAQPIVRMSYDQPVETYQTNVLGTINVLEALRKLDKPCTAIFITTDKCYENREWLHGYREEDALGGFDPYSSSKAACEIAISSWQRSFFHGHPVKIARARAGNVIGGGDWAPNRIVPDIARCIATNSMLTIRNPSATRPWQHVLEPLCGYLTLAAKMTGIVSSNTTPHHPICELLNSPAPSATAFNFGPALDSNRTVLDVVKEIHARVPFRYEISENPQAPHEAGMLNLATDKAYHTLGWLPQWDFATTIEKTALWYQNAAYCRTPEDFCSLTRQQIEEYGS